MIRGESMSTYNSNKVVSSFSIFAFSTIILAIILLSGNFSKTIVVIYSILAIILSYRTIFYVCSDIIEKKGYSIEDFPLFILLIMLGVFAIFYTAALPDRNLYRNANLESAKTANI